MLPLRAPLLSVMVVVVVEEVDPGLGRFPGEDNKSCLICFLIGSDDELDGVNMCCFFSFFLLLVAVVVVVEESTFDLLSKDGDLVLLVSLPLEDFDFFVAFNSFSLDTGFNSLRALAASLESADFDSLDDNTAFACLGGFNSLVVMEAVCFLVLDDDLVSLLDEDDFVSLVTLFVFCNGVNFGGLASL